MTDRTFDTLANFLCFINKRPISEGEKGEQNSPFISLMGWERIRIDRTRCAARGTAGGGEAWRGGGRAGRTTSRSLAFSASVYSSLQSISTKTIF